MIFRATARSLWHHVTPLFDYAPGPSPNLATISHRARNFRSRSCSASRVCRMPVETRQRLGFLTPRAGLLLLVVAPLVLSLSACGGASRASAPAAVATPDSTAGAAREASATASVVAPIDSDADGIPTRGSFTRTRPRKLPPLVQGHRRGAVLRAERGMERGAARLRRPRPLCVARGPAPARRRWLARMGAAYEAFAPTCAPTLWSAARSAKNFSARLRLVPRDGLEGRDVL